MWIGRIIVMIVCVKGLCGDDVENKDTRIDNSADLHDENKISSRVQRSPEPSEKPKLSICCPPGTFMTTSEYMNCSSNTSKPVYDLEIPQIFTEYLKPSEKGLEDFELIYGIPCENSIYEFSLNASTLDGFYFLEDGRLHRHHFYVPDTYVDIDNYCLSSWMGDNGTYTKIIGCQSLERNELLLKVMMLVVVVNILMSSVALAATFFIYALLPELRTIQGMNLMAYAASWFWTKVGIIMIISKVATPWYNRRLCIFTGYVIYFWSVSCFFWLNVMCFDVWRAFVNLRVSQGNVKQRKRKKFIIYSIYAWGCASIMTGVCLIVDFLPIIPDDFVKPRFGETTCWFRVSDITSKEVYYYGPMVVSLFGNVVLFIATAVKIRQHERDSAIQLQGCDSRRHYENKQWLNHYLKLFMVMGIHQIISRLIQVASAHLDKKTPQYFLWIMIFPLSLEGLLIFIMFVWNANIKRLLMNRLGCSERNSQSGNPTRNDCHSGNSPVDLRGNVTTTSKRF